MTTETFTLHVACDGVPAADVKEFLAAYVENRFPRISRPAFFDVDEAQGEKRLRVLSVLDGALVLTKEQADRLEDLAATAGPGRLEPLRPACNAKGDIELEFNGVGISAMPYDRLLQSLYDVLAEAERRGARVKVNMTPPDPPVEHVEMRVAYKGA